MILGQIWAPRSPDSRSGRIIGDFWLSQLVQCLLDFCLGIVCSDEDGYVLHACSDETGKQPFTRRELQSLLQDLLVDSEGVADNCSIIWTWQRSHEVRV